MGKRKPIRRNRRTKAATEDVLSRGVIEDNPPPKWRKHYRRLIQIRDQLLRQQSDLSQAACEEAPSFSMHIADAGTDAYDRDWALGMVSSDQNAVYEIDEALNRIRNGSYGICELTGKRIEAARLAAIPWTRFSAAAERQLENEGGLPHTRLGPRETVVRISASKVTEEDE